MDHSFNRCPGTPACLFSNFPVSICPHPCFAHSPPSSLSSHAQAQREEILRQQKEQEAAKKRILARQKRAAREAQMRPQTPEPVDGRKHADIQTENYLEELSDRVPEKDVDVQTDPFLDRPPSPLFIPMRDAVDVETQVLAGDLFDFDLEVEPILEVLTGKTLEQGMIEVMEEEELAAMKQHQVRTNKRWKREEQTWHLHCCVLPGLLCAGNAVSQA